MNALTDFRTVYIPSVLPPKPAPKAPVGFTMEQLKADARAAEARLHKTWHQAIPSQPKPTPSTRTIRWTPEVVARLEKDVLTILRKRGPMSGREIMTLLRTPCNRHKLSDVLRDLRKAGKVTSRQVSNVRQEWSAT